MTREEGFYMVLLTGKWTIAEYKEEQWLLTGQFMRFNDDAFELIIDRKIKLPDEKQRHDSSANDERAKEIE